MLKRSVAERDSSARFSISGVASLLFNKANMEVGEDKWELRARKPMLFQALAQLELGLVNDNPLAGEIASC
jgi:hypothetical protein